MLSLERVFVKLRVFHGNGKWTDGSTVPFLWFVGAGSLIWGQVESPQSAPRPYWDASGRVLHDRILNFFASVTFVFLLRFATGGLSPSAIYIYYIVLKQNPS